MSGADAHRHHQGGIQHVIPPSPRDRMNNVPPPLATGKQITEFQGGRSRRPQYLHATLLRIPRNGADEQIVQRTRLHVREQIVLSKKLKRQKPIIIIGMRRTSGHGCCFKMRPLVGPHKQGIPIDHPIFAALRRRYHSAFLNEGSHRTRLLAQHTHCVTPLKIHHPLKVRNGLSSSRPPVSHRKGSIYTHR